MGGLDYSASSSRSVMPGLTAAAPVPDRPAGTIGPGRAPLAGAHSAVGAPLAACAAAQALLAAAGKGAAASDEELHARHGAGRAARTAPKAARGPGTAIEQMRGACSSGTAPVQDQTRSRKAA